MNLSRMNKWIWFGISALLILFDQLSKHCVSLHFSPYEPYAIMPMLNITLAFNTGAAFSFLSHAGEWHHWFFPMPDVVPASGSRRRYQE